jgi:hypothetical protein
MEWGVCPWLRRLGILNDCTMSFGFCIGWMHRVLYFRFGLPIIDYLPSERSELFPSALSPTDLHHLLRRHSLVRTNHRLSHSRPTQILLPPHRYLTSS